MNEADKHLRQAEAELRKAKRFVRGREDTKTLVELLMGVGILANAYADNGLFKPKGHHGG